MKKLIQVGIVAVLLLSSIIAYTMTLPVSHVGTQIKTTNGNIEDDLAKLQTLANTIAAVNPQVQTPITYPSYTPKAVTKFIAWPLTPPPMYQNANEVIVTLDKSEMTLTSALNQLLNSIRSNITRKAAACNIGIATPLLITNSNYKFYDAKPTTTAHNPSQLVVKLNGETLTVQQAMDTIYATGVSATNELIANCNNGCTPDTVVNVSFSGLVRNDGYSGYWAADDAGSIEFNYSSGLIKTGYVLLADFRVDYFDGSTTIHHVDTYVKTAESATTTIPGNWSRMGTATVSIEPDYGVPGRAGTVWTNDAQKKIFGFIWNDQGVSGSPQFTVKINTPPSVKQSCLNALNPTPIIQPQLPVETP